jgi:hypothetical protein
MIFKNNIAQTLWWRNGFLQKSLPQKGSAFHRFFNNNKLILKQKMPRYPNQIPIYFHKKKEATFWMGNHMRSGGDL